MKALHIKEALYADDLVLRQVAIRINGKNDRNRSLTPEEKAWYRVSGWNVHPGRIEFVNGKNQVVYIYERKLA